MSEIDPVIRTLLGIVFLAVFFGIPICLLLRYHKHKEAEHTILSREANANYRCRKKAEEFEEIFGFEPDLIEEERYEKEIFLKLGFFAQQLHEAAKDYKEYSDLYKDDYDEAYAQYHGALEILKYFAPEFQKQIPHWTEVKNFVSQILANRRGPRVSKRSTVHT